MATLTAAGGSSTYPVAGGAGYAQSLKCRSSVYQVTSASPAAGDYIEFFRLPKGAIVVGGEYSIGKIETTTSGATFDMDVGWNNNGVDASDDDGFGNFGAPSFAAVTGVKPEATFAKMPFGNIVGLNGQKTFSAETIVRGYVVASATNLDSATICVKAYYYVP